MVNKGTEDEAPGEYFDLLNQTFRLLDENKLKPEVVEGWFSFQYLKLQGNAPNLTHDAAHQPLDEAKNYRFETSEGTFIEDSDGQFNSDAIKAWRVLLGGTADNIGKVKGLHKALAPTFNVLKQFVEYTQ
jgi:recombinational DNA repair protein (RecF pathway)